MLLVLALALADEGMWLPEQVPGMADDLRRQGLGLDAATLADPAGATLGAVVSLGHCTASFVSSDGLILTNGHCVSDYLESASTANHDYRLEGYLATDRRKELSAGPAARAWVTERIDDVTTKVLGKLPTSLDDRNRVEAIQKNVSAIVTACEKQVSRPRCQVVPVYEGREWRLVTRRELRDLRVVYAPPETVYAFGGDVDNWQWPRQCGDFAMLRAWSAPDGTSAAYAEENVPYSPPQHLRLAPGGARPGEFVMIAGYPSATYRWRTADEARHAAEVRYPYGRDLLSALGAVAERAAAASKESAIRLGPSLFRYANARKNYAGMIDNFGRSDIVHAKEAQQAALEAWIAADPRRAPYGASLAELRKVVAEDMAYWRRDRVYSALVQTPLLLNTAVTAYRLAFEQQFPDASRDPGFQARDRADIGDRFRGYDRILDLPSDRALMKEILQQSQALPETQRIPPLDAWLAKAGSVQNALDELYASPALATAEARLRLLDQKQPDFERAADPWIRLAVALDTWHRSVRAEKRVRDGALARLRPAYMEAMLKMHPGAVYPEANATLRLSFGKVDGYTPEDGAVHLPQTTLGGMARKVRESPFDAPLRVLEEVPAAPRTRWSDPTLGDVPVNFLSTVDNTNGNSGSPTLNAHGEIVGLVFDRNWEAVAADWRYDPALTRSIHVDVRYLLWMLDEVEHAQVLLAELGVRG